MKMGMNEDGYNHYQAGKKNGNLGTQLPANLALRGRILRSLGKISQNLSARSQNPSAKCQIGWESGSQVPRFFPSLIIIQTFSLKILETINKMMGDENEYYVN